MQRAKPAAVGVALALHQGPYCFGGGIIAQGGWDTRELEFGRALQVALVKHLDLSRRDQNRPEKDAQAGQTGPEPYAIAHGYRWAR
jgi:hypothetical protein